MSGAMLAYHGDFKIKAKYLRRVQDHAKADELVQGYGYWRNGKGCAVGCCMHLNAEGGAHQAYPRELGIPEELAHLEDALFELLDPASARAWPARFLSAITPGADLSRVYDLWSAWNLIDPVDGVITLVTDDFPDIQRIVRETGAACLAGTRISAEKEKEAAWAARSRAAWAGESAWAASAAWTAWAARSRAAWAGESAWAASAAWESMASTWAARAAYYVRAADKLIELLEAAPVARRLIRNPS